MKNHINLRGNTLYSLKFDLKLRLTICLIVCSLFQIHANTFSKIENTEIGSIQKITITGTVSDANGPLPGVNIIVTLGLKRVRSRKNSTQACNLQLEFVHMSVPELQLIQPSPISSSPFLSRFAPSMWRRRITNTMIFDVKETNLD